MYRVLYRKYRPRSFDDVVGQEHITTTLKNEVATGHLSHAYLFTGSRGTGKTSCAKILASAVNCLNPRSGNPCGECEICRGIADGSILDIIEMDAASNRGIDDIRLLVDEAHFKPAKCKYRVYIIDEVHMLTKESFNALLKTLEEPPKHVIFILATTEVHKILPTILSRCQRFDFHRIAPSEISDRLKFVAKHENIRLSDSAAMIIASVADGALRDALSLLDRCTAISTDIDDEVVRNAAGLAQRSYLFELAACAINKNTAKSLEIIDGLYGESKDMASLCDELLAHFRALMLIKSVKNPRDILIMSDDEFDRAQTQSDYLSLADIVYFMDVLSRAYRRMGKGTGDRTELEMAMVKLSSAELDSTVDALTARVAALEKSVKSGMAVKYQPDIYDEKNREIIKSESKNDISDKVNRIQKDMSEDSVEKSVPPEKSEENNSYEDSVVKPARRSVENGSNRSLDEIYSSAVPFPEWAEVVNNMKSASITIASAFSNSAAYVSGNYLLIDTDNEMAFELLKTSSRREEVRKSIREVTGRAYRLGPYKRPVKVEKQEDPLDILKKKLDGMGIEVVEN